MVWNKATELAIFGRASQQLAASHNTEMWQIILWDRGPAAFVICRCHLTVGAFPHSPGSTKGCTWVREPWFHGREIPAVLLAWRTRMLSPCSPACVTHTHAVSPQPCCVTHTHARTPSSPCCPSNTFGFVSWRSFLNTVISILIGYVALSKLFQNSVCDKVTIS